MVRIALANLRFPTTQEDVLAMAISAIADAARAGARIICFPEEFVPGYRLGPHAVAAPDSTFLERAWSQIAASAAEAKISVILGTERFVDGGLRISCLVINPDGTIQGWQDKVQLDSSEDSLFTPGTERHIFQAGELKFGIAICHEGCATRRPCGPPLDKARTSYSILITIGPNLAIMRRTASPTRGIRFMRKP